VFLYLYVLVVLLFRYRLAIAVLDAELRLLTFLFPALHHSLPPVIVSSLGYCMNTRVCMTFDLHFDTVPEILRPHVTITLRRVFDVSSTVYFLSVALLPHRNGRGTSGCTSVLLQSSLVAGIDLRRAFI